MGFCWRRRGFGTSPCTRYTIGIYCLIIITLFNVLHMAVCNIIWKESKWNARRGSETIIVNVYDNNSILHRDTGRISGINVCIFVSALSIFFRPDEFTILTERIFYGTLHRISVYYCI